MNRVGFMCMLQIGYNKFEMFLVLNSGAMLIQVKTQQIMRQEV